MLLGCKDDIFPMKRFANIFLIFCSKLWFCILDRIASSGVVLTRTNKLCFGAVIRQTIFAHVNPSFDILKSDSSEVLNYMDDLLA